MLSQLAANDWHLDSTAQKLGNTREELVIRLEKAGFGYLLNNQVIEKARKKARKQRL